MAVLIRMTEHGHRVAACGATCYNAKTTVCHCICNGLNHGVGLHAAIHNTRTAGPAAVAAFTAAHPYTRDWKVQFHLPPIPAHQPLLF